MALTARAQIEADQLAKLQALLRAILPDNSFYRAKLGAGLEIASLNEYSENIPFTFKHELIADQIAHPPYGSNLTFPLDRYTRFSQTSGSTGKPVRWLDTQQGWDWMAGNWTTVFQKAGVVPTDRIFFAFSFGPFLGFWVAFDAATRMGCLSIPGGGMRSAARLTEIIDNAATVMCCTPTYAIRLAEVAFEENIDLRLAKISKIIVAGEPGGSIPGTRARIETLWNGAAVIDHHGMTEVGPVSYGCPSRAGVLHVIESSYFAEVIDPKTNHLAGPGETGELVLTNLGRPGSPLLRYRTGDLVLRSDDDRCECGSHDLALAGGILGRTDDMVVVRGVNVFPSAVEDILQACGGVAEYRVEIRTSRGLVELTISVEPLSGDDHGLAQRIEAALRNAFALRIPVSVAPRGSMPRFEMKANRWLRL